MADETEQPVEEVERTPSPTEETPPEPSDDSTLQEVEGSEGVESVGEEPEAPSEESTYQARLAEAEQRNKDLQIENAFWRGKTDQTAAPVREAPASEEPKELSKKELEDLLRTDPAEALLEIERRTEARVTKRLRGELAEQTTVQTVRQQDEQGAYNRYPDLRTNPEFFKRTDQLVRLLYDRNGKKYARGDIMTATAAVYGDMVREGLIEPPKRKLNGQDPPTPKETVRRTIQDPGLRRPAQSPAPSSNGKDPFRGLNFSKEDREKVAKRSKEFGISLEQWRKNYDESERERNG